MQLQHSPQLNAESLLVGAQRRSLCGGKGCGTSTMASRQTIRRRFSTISVPKKGKERREFDNRSFEIENPCFVALLCTLSMSVDSEYLRAADDHAIDVIRFHCDRGEHFTRAKAGAGRDGLDSRR